MRYIIAAVLLLGYHAFAAPEPVVDGNSKIKPTNLLYIMFDDLRPELSIYGKNYMVTPNFERLAKRSVVFDVALCQISVCNPSRDSILTGLRPDTTGTYGFQHSYRPHMTWATHLVKSGYNTASYGKINHWPSDSKDEWSNKAEDMKWYDYQSWENGIMNSSTMPDVYKKEEDFRDYVFASKAIAKMDEMVKTNKLFHLAIGFKLPHLQVHMPYKYYKIYKDKENGWNQLTKKNLRYPPTALEFGIVNPIDPSVRFMRGEGSLPANRSTNIQIHGRAQYQQAFTAEMYNELMTGYAAAVSFVDAQVGRLEHDIIIHHCLAC
jgi:iduronate 2-sulfatase